MDYECASLYNLRLPTQELRSLSLSLSLSLFLSDATLGSNPTHNVEVLPVCLPLPDVLVDAPLL